MRLSIYYSTSVKFARNCFVRRKDIENRKRKSSEKTSDTTEQIQNNMNSKLSFKRNAV